MGEIGAHIARTRDNHLSLGIFYGFHLITVDGSDQGEISGRPGAAWKSPHRPGSDSGLRGLVSLMGMDVTGVNGLLDRSEKH